MKILFLGTGAADWKNKPECEIENDERRWSTVIIDRYILVDVSPQSYDFAKKIGVDVSKIIDLFITHTHLDHYCKDTLMMFRKDTDVKINIYCHSKAVEKLGLSDEEMGKFNIFPLENKDSFEFGNGYKVTALSANHIVAGSEETALHYVFEKNDNSLFYGCDGGWFTASTWEYIRKLSFDKIVLDATVGDKDGDFRLGTHNSIPMLRLIVAAMKENNMLNENCTIIASHLARTLHTSREETERIFKEFGMLVAYDGVEF